MNRTETRKCQNCHNQFTIEPEDFNFYERIKVPAPTWCPECRIQRRIMWRNEKTMYKKRCEATGKLVFSFISPNAPYKIFDRDYWWSDKWDPMAYGRDIDFSKPFLTQVSELLHEIPWFSRSVINNTNSDYCMNCSYQKNCYLVFHASENESCYYGVGVNFSKDCIDNSFIDKCEFCHECFFCAHCYQTFYSVDCENCQNIYFCRDCVNCHDCIGCVGLRNKQFHIFNKPYSKELYQEELKKIQTGSQTFLEEMRGKTLETWVRFPVKFAHGLHNSNVTGEYVYHSKNIAESYIVTNSENLKYCQNIFLNPGAKDAYDYSFFGKGAEIIYETCSSGIDIYDVKFSAFIYPGSQRISYSVMCPSSQDLFGCVGLSKKQYCILNKQYSKEEYAELVPKIIAHMNEKPYLDSAGRVYRYGEYFPPEFCPFGYNTTVAQEYFPKTMEEAKSGGWPWIEPGSKENDPTISWKDLPDKISDVEESITKEIILCESWEREGAERALEHNCSKVFRITTQELQFYKRFNLPLPRKCFNSRHHERGKLRNPLKLWHRQCQCAGQKSENNIYINTITHQHGTSHCPNEFETSYSSEGKEIVYCEQCYNAEVV